MQAAFSGGGEPFDLAVRGGYAWSESGRARAARWSHRDGLWSLDRVALRARGEDAVLPSQAVH